MGILDKLKIWKKRSGGEEDILNFNPESQQDLGLGSDLNQGLDALSNTGIDQGVGGAQIGTINESNAFSGIDQDIMAKRAQQSYGSIEQNSLLNTQNFQNQASEQNLRKEIEMLNLKIDNLRAEMKLVLEKLEKIEKSRKEEWKF